MKANQDKSTLHPRNKHRSRYDFKSLTNSCPELGAFVMINKYGDESVDFSNPDAVKALNKALLQHFYQIQFWDIPAGYLCPPIPGRADYLHYAADLLGADGKGSFPTGKKIKVLDIGVGANCIYPIIGHSEYGWNFVGSDIDLLAVRSATSIVQANAQLSKAIEIRHQANKKEIFLNIIKRQELFDLVICNPPFHASAEEALTGSQRKARNLGNKNYSNPVLNFGGQGSELWTEGGELAFVGRMIAESKLYRDQCLWFTSLVSKSEHLDAVYVMLKRAEVSETKISEMATGNKITRIVAWTFLDQSKRRDWMKAKDGALIGG